MNIDIRKTSIKRVIYNKHGFIFVLKEVLTFFKSLSSFSFSVISLAVFP